MNTNLVYCIDCGEMVELQNFPFFGDLHDTSLPVFGDSGEVVGVDAEVCYFSLGFAYCPMPEFEEGWQDRVAIDEDVDAIINIQTIGLRETAVML